MSTCPDGTRRLAVMALTTNGPEPPKEWRLDRCVTPEFLEGVGVAEIRSYLIAEFRDIIKRQEPSAVVDGEPAVYEVVRRFGYDERIPF